MTDDLDDLEQQLRQFSAKPISPAFRKRVLQAAAQQIVRSHWKKYVFWSATAAVLSLALLLPFQKALSIPSASNLEPRKKTDVEEQIVVQNTASNSPVEMNIDFPVYDEKKILERYYFHLARNQSVKQDVAVAKAKVPGAARRASGQPKITPIVLRPMILREFKMISIAIRPSPSLDARQLPNQSNIQ